MASKSDKEKKPSGKANSESGKDSSKKESPKPKKQMEEDDEDDIMDDEEMETSSSKKKPAISSKKGKGEDDDSDDDGEDVVDDWDKVEEEEEWDPDFEEFDLPKSKGKKAAGTGGGKKGLEEEDEFKLDDEFKDMGLFNESNYDDEEDDF